VKLFGSLLVLLAAPLAAQDDEPTPYNYPEIPKSAAKVEGFVSPGWVIVSRANGDLNRDGRSDVALALWTEEASKADGYATEQGPWPFYRIVIAVAQPNGGYRLVTDIHTLLEPPGYSGAYEDALSADDLRIDRGKLDVSRQLLRGRVRLRFQWLNRAFRLIGYEYSGSDGRCITDTSINFLTRKATIETGALDENGETRRFTRRIKRPPVTIEEAASEGYYPERDMSGPGTYCISHGMRF
jgi:hypothetical protein